MFVVPIPLYKVQNNVWEIVQLFYDKTQPITKANTREMILCSLVFLWFFLCLCCNYCKSKSHSVGNTKLLANTCFFGNSTQEFHLYRVSYTNSSQVRSHLMKQISCFINRSWCGFWLIHVNYQCPYGLLLSSARHLLLGTARRSISTGKHVIIILQNTLNICGLWLPEWYLLLMAIGRLFLFHIIV